MAPSLPVHWDAPDTCSPGPQYSRSTGASRGRLPTPQSTTIAAKYSTTHSTALSTSLHCVTHCPYNADHVTRIPGRCTARHGPYRPSVTLSGSDPEGGGRCHCSSRLALARHSILSFNSYAFYLHTKKAPFCSRRSKRFSTLDVRPVAFLASKHR